MVRLIIALVITGVWAISYIAAIFNPAYHPAVEINAVMLMVAGYFFGSGIRKLKNGNGNGSGSK